MEENKRKSFRKNNRQTGITLVALVVTVVILLILAGISIKLVLDDNGIISRAKQADIIQRGSTVEDVVTEWKYSKKMDDYADSVSETKEDIINSLIEKNLITEEEKNEINDKGYTKIGTKDIIFSDGLDDTKQVITRGDQEILFNKVIQEGDILITKNDYQSYEIKGISISEEGEAIREGSLNGKTGVLEIVGDIKDTTFKYTLNDFMHGDEEFFLKIDIDGEEYTKKIIVVQGDCITYEEDFVKFEFESSGTFSSEWTVEENENYSGGKALVCTVAEAGESAKVVKWDFYGSGIEILSMDSATKPARIVTVLMQEIDGKKRGFINDITVDCESGEIYQSDIFEKKKMTNLSEKNFVANGKYSMKFYGSIPMNSKANEVKAVFDAVRIYK